MKIVFAGTPLFAIPALQALINTSHDIIGVYTQPDRPAGRGRQIQESPVKQLALQYKLPVFQPISLKNPKESAILAELAPDIMIVVAYGLILPETILALPKHGCINIHASLLPKFRGAAPIHRAILAGETTTGITIMHMEKGLDTGDMLYKLSTPIELTDSFNLLHDRLAVMGAEALMYVLDHLNRHHSFMIAEKQVHSEASYAEKIHPAETILDFRQDAVSLVRAINAFYPAKSFLQRCLIKCWSAEIEKNNPSYSYIPSIPGEILHADKTGIQVNTGNGILKLLKLQLAGGKILTAEQLLHSKSALFCKGNIFSGDSNA